ncbi:unnamed protein product [Amoebophrya sp. A25]|nr:unnamed protein product [Amoebophrya sp. A25]|eukprot:GSA25T00011287001.1
MTTPLKPQAKRRCWADESEDLGSPDFGPMTFTPKLQETEQFSLNDSQSTAGAAGGDGKVYAVEVWEVTESVMPADIERWFKSFGVETQNACRKGKSATSKTKDEICLHVTLANEEAYKKAMKLTGAKLNKGVDPTQSFIRILEPNSALVDIPIDAPIEQERGKSRKGRGGKGNSKNQQYNNGNGRDHDFGYHGSALLSPKQRNAPLPRSPQTMDWRGGNRAKNKFHDDHPDHYINLQYQHGSGQPQQQHSSGGQGQGHGGQHHQSPHLLASIAGNNSSGGGGMLNNMHSGGHGPQGQHGSHVSPPGPQGMMHHGSSGGSYNINMGGGQHAQHGSSASKGGAGSGSAQQRGSQNYGGGYGLGPSSSGASGYNSASMHQGQLPAGGARTGKQCPNGTSMTSTGSCSTLGPNNNGNTMAGGTSGSQNQQNNVSGQHAEQQTPQRGATNGDNHHLDLGRQGSGLPMPPVPAGGGRPQELRLDNNLDYNPASTVVYNLPTNLPHGYNMPPPPVVPHNTPPTKRKFSGVSHSHYSEQDGRYGDHHDKQSSYGGGGGNYSSSASKRNHDNRYGGGYNDNDYGYYNRTTSHTAHGAKDTSAGSSSGGHKGRGNKGGGGNWGNAQKDQNQSGASASSSKQDGGKQSQNNEGNSAATKASAQSGGTSTDGGAGAAPGGYRRLALKPRTVPLEQVAKGDHLDCYLEARQATSKSGEGEKDGAPGDSTTPGASSAPSHSTTAGTSSNQQTGKGTPADLYSSFDSSRSEAEQQSVGGSVAGGANDNQQNAQQAASTPSTGGGGGGQPRNQGGKRNQMQQWNNNWSENQEWTDNSGWHQQNNRHHHGGGKNKQGGGGGKHGGGGAAPWGKRSGDSPDGRNLSEQDYPSLSRADADQSWRK